MYIVYVCVYSYNLFIEPVIESTSISYYMYINMIMLLQRYTCVIINHLIGSNHALHCTV